MKNPGFEKTNTSVFQHRQLLRNIRDFYLSFDEHLTLHWNVSYFGKPFVHARKTSKNGNKRAYVQVDCLETYSSSYSSYKSQASATSNQVSGGLTSLPFVCQKTKHQVFITTEQTTSLHRWHDFWDNNLVTMATLAVGKKDEYILL